MSASEPRPDPHAAPRFRFACQRSGRCCTHGEGHVWLLDGEIERLARALELTPEVFVRRFVRRAYDPHTARERASLAERDGRCVLLEGERHCTVYAERPEQCRTFPFWPRVRAGGAAFEAARAICPGIAVRVDDDLARRARTGLDELHRRFPAGDEPCPFADRGATVWASGLEADRLVGEPDAVAPASSADGSEGDACPGWDAGRCRARAARPLACRLHGTDVEHDDALAALRALEAELGYPRAYGKLADLVRSRQGRSSEGATS